MQQPCECQRDAGHLGFGSQRNLMLVLPLAPKDSLNQPNPFAGRFPLRYAGSYACDMKFPGGWDAKAALVMSAILGSFL